MSIVLPIVVVAFVAFCVWLTVRIINRRERRAKWTAVTILVVLAAYPLSFGPWCWTVGRHEQEWGAGSKGDSFYHPILRLWCYGPLPIRQSLKWFANVGTEVQLDVHDIIGDGRLNVLPDSI